MLVHSPSLLIYLLAFYHTHFLFFCQELIIDYLLLLFQTQFYQEPVDPTAEAVQERV